MTSKPLEERFWEKVDKGDPDECWKWRAGTSAGYGRIKVNGVHEGAHRVSYRLKNGKIQDNLQVNHKCDNPSCVNPNHLYLGTQSENVQDAFNHGDATQLGEENSCAKLTEEQVGEIKQLLQTDLTQRKISNKFGVSRSAIGYIDQGRRWSHV